MKRLVYFCLAFLLAVGLSRASSKSSAGAKTFSGEISDSMCGVKHMMPGSAKNCTLECIKEKSKFVLVDPATGKVYNLSDQEKPREFAGQKVKVTGTLTGKTITVKSIVAAQ